MNYCLVEAEKNLVHRDLKDILFTFIKEDTERRNIYEIRNKIESSGHSFLA